jgi:putative oxidoreductase
MAETHSRGKVIAIWVLRVLLGFAFLGSGGAKLAGSPQMVEIFTKIGFGQGFRILTGILEVLGAVGLFIPRFSSYAALLLAAVMIGAVGFHLTILGGNPTPPIVLLVLSGILAWLSRDAARS